MTDRILIIAFCLLAVLLWALPSYAEIATTAPLVAVKATINGQPGVGNGVIIYADDTRAIIATAGHNVHNASMVAVCFNAQCFRPQRVESVFSGDDDFAAIEIRGNLAWVNAVPVFAGELPYGEPLEVVGYWPTQLQWAYRRYPLRRIMHRMFGDSLDQPITPGVSGSPVIYRNQVAGIVTGINRPQPGSPSVVTFFTPSPVILRHLTAWGMCPPANSVTPVLGQPTAPKMLIDDADQIADLEQSLNQSIADIRKQVEKIATEDTPPARSADPEPVSPDEPASPPSGGTSGPLLPPDKVASHDEPSDRGTDAPLRGKVASWAWDGVSAWGWATVAGAVGGPLGLIVGYLGGRVHRRLKSAKGGDPVSTPTGGQRESLQPKEIPPPRNTDVGRERIVEKVIDRSEVERERYEAEIRRLKESRGPTNCQPPFPRYMDEADQLRELRQSEGRVAALDALVGMKFDDEVRNMLETTTDPVQRNIIRDLKDRVMDAVDQIAPIATPVKRQSNG
jgi:hypothetical protein